METYHIELADGTAIDIHVESTSGHSKAKEAFDLLKRSGLNPIHTGTTKHPPIPREEFSLLCKLHGANVEKAMENQDVLHAIRTGNKYKLKKLLRTC
jgi:hypothetical protein